MKVKYLSKVQELGRMQDYARMNKRHDTAMRDFVNSMRQNLDVLHQISDYND